METDLRQIFSGDRFETDFRHSALLRGQISLLGSTLNSSGSSSLLLVNLMFEALYCDEALSLNLSTFEIDPSVNQVFPNKKETSKSTSK